MVETSAQLNEDTVPVADVMYCKQSGGAIVNTDVKCIQSQCQEKRITEIGGTAGEHCNLYLPRPTDRG